MSAAPPIGILGAGSFGRGLAHAATRAGHRVVLWSRSSPDVALDGVEVTSDPAHLGDAELIFLAVPSAHAPTVTQRLCGHLDGSHLVVHVSRGLVGGDLRTLTQVIRQETPCRRVGALAGPLVAQALVEGTPGGAVIGTRFPEVATAVRDAIAGDTLRIYHTMDVVGIEVASAMVGLVALVAGYVKTLGFGPSALAVLATRGMAEASKIGTTIGAEERTFSGLAGLGDLIAAISGDDRPELRLGRALAEGAKPGTASKGAGGHIESLAVARQAADYAQRLGIDTPIVATVADVVEGRLDAKAAVDQLMARRVGWE